VGSRLAVEKVLDWACGDGLEILGIVFPEVGTVRQWGKTLGRAETAHKRDLCDKASASFDNLVHDGVSRWID